MSIRVVVETSGVAETYLAYQLPDKYGAMASALGLMILLLGIDWRNEAVEYIRGIPFVKTFGLSVFSFKRFQKTIHDYERWTISYTKELRLLMMSYTLAVNSIFIFLIATGLFTEHDKNFLMNLILTIIAAPLI